MSMTELEGIVARLNAVRPPPVIDPTANVKDALYAAVTRLDDIRDVDRQHARDLREINDRHTAEVRALRDELNKANKDAIDAQALAESRRLDAQRAEDKITAAVSQARAELTAANLAQQVTATEKTLAAASEASAKALATAFESAFKGVIERILPLEQARYQQVGVKEQRTESTQERRDIKSDNRWLVGIAMSVPSWLLAVIALVYALTSVPK